MAKKKNKKRQRSFTEEAKRQAEQEKLANEKDRSKKRLDPTARLLLYGDIIFLAVASILGARDMLSSTVDILCTVVGILMLLLALWFQFRPRDDGLGKGPRL